MLASDLLGRTAYDADGAELGRVADLIAGPDGRVREVRAELLTRIAAAGHSRIDVDLVRLRYLSSSGIALLLDLAAATRPGSILTVTAAHGGAPARILELSGLDGISAGNNLAVNTVPAEDIDRDATRR